ncbi:KH domain-containing protein [bacterium]|nr:KH domain-containing protein [bacterium]MBQ6436361.1 KH domain-containing protein [bacterium]
MKELIEYVLKGLVNYPDEIKVDEETLADGLTIYSISANKEDYGRVIGRQGALIQSLRTIVKARAIKEKRKVMVRVMTDDVREIKEKAAEAPEKAPVEEVVKQEALDDNLL